LFGVDGEVSNDVYVFRTWCFVFVWPKGNNTANTSPTAELLETDYLVVGAGASGMVFVDELLHRTEDTTFVLIDRLSQPGGHWNHAYSFVRLHQPSYFYGVNSELLEGEKGKIDYASKHEILTYYEKVLRKMLDTGRVVFLSQTRDMVRFNR